MGCWWKSGAGGAAERAPSPDVAGASAKHAHTVPRAARSLRAAKSDSAPHLLLASIRFCGVISLYKRSPALHVSAGLYPCTNILLNTGLTSAGLPRPLLVLCAVTPSLYFGHPSWTPPPTRAVRRAFGSLCSFPFYRRSGRGSPPFAAHLVHPQRPDRSGRRYSSSSVRPFLHHPG